MHRTPVWLAFLVALVGCQGTIEEPWRPGSGPVLDCSNPSQEGAPVPTRRLTAPQLEATVADVFGLDVHYPLSDEVLIGYRANVSSGLDTTSARDTMAAAETIALEIAPAVAEEPGCLGDCAQHVLDTFGQALFRRPLDEDTQMLFAALYAEGYAEGGRGGDARAEGVRWMLEAMLQSPRFLYQVELAEDGQLDGFSMASRLSYALWNGPPDAELLESAARGDLDTVEGIRAAAERMIDDARFERGAEQFVTQWLDLDLLDEAQARPDLEQLDADTVAWLQREPVLFFVEHVRSGAGLPELLTSTQTVDALPLQALYGDDIAFVDVEAGTVELDPTHRAGILTLPGVQAALAHAEETSPTLRGRAVLANLLCDPPPPPPAGVVPTLPPPTPGATTRERLEEHFSNDACAGCHASMDGIGFAFEHYDHFGRWRDLDNGRPVDASSDFVLGGRPIVVDGGPEMAIALSDRRQATECVARQWTRFTSGVVESSELDCTIASMADALESAGGLREMVLAYVTSPWFRKPADLEND